MKVRIPKNQLSKSAIVIDYENLGHSEETMRSTWAEFGDALARKEFEYTDTDKALDVTFLKQFDRWFQGIGKSEMSIDLANFASTKCIGRGTIIREDEPTETPSYDRFLPIAKFISQDNRFSPSGIEWLYLAVGNSQNSIQECAEKECRAKSGERFAFCNFQMNPEYNKLKVVDLTIADALSYKDINDRLRKLEQCEYDKRLKYAKKHGYWQYRLNYKDDSAEQEVSKWLLYTYAKMMSTNIFVPIKTNDKKLEYAPFQTLAMYFIREDFDGIIYSSTVCPESKNIVLFNKKYAIPCGEVLDYTLTVQ